MLRLPHLLRRSAQGRGQSAGDSTRRYLTCDLSWTSGDSTYLNRIGTLIRDARRHKGLTQSELADLLGTSQSAVARIEQNKQNLSLEMLARIGESLDSEFVSLGTGGPQHLRIVGGKQLSGSIPVKTSKNAAVGLLCRPAQQKGRTTLRNLARIEEVNRIIEVLTSVGVKVRWLPDSSDLEIIPPTRLELDSIDLDAARRTRTIIMFLGPCSTTTTPSNSRMPVAATWAPAPSSRTWVRCAASASTSRPRTASTRPRSPATPPTAPTRSSPHRARRHGDRKCSRRRAPPRHDDHPQCLPNYMVQDVCFFLTKLGVIVEGIGTTTLTVTGVEHIDVDVDYSPSEDPIEAMSLIAAASSPAPRSPSSGPHRVPRDRTCHLGPDGPQYDQSPEYVAANGETRLVDLTIHPGPLKAPIDKIAPMAFPGLNIDNLPFFALIAACADGTTMIHDWVYENRAIYLTELNKVGAQVQLLDPHRVMVTGPTPKWRAAEVMCPPALRPGVVILLAMLAAPGTSVLRNVYVINRGYEELAERLNAPRRDDRDLPRHLIRTPRTRPHGPGHGWRRGRS